MWSSTNVYYEVRRRSSVFHEYINIVLIYKLQKVNSWFRSHEFNLVKRREEFMCTGWQLKSQSQSQNVTVLKQKICFITSWMRNLCINSLVIRTISFLNFFWGYWKICMRIDAYKTIKNMFCLSLSMFWGVTICKR